jgi:uncharacterized membrane protein
MTEWKSLDFLISILVLQFLMYITVFLDVPVARQILGFVYFTFVPGLVIIRLLKMDEISELETILLSVGFSIAFLMLGGFLIDVFYLIFNIPQPLSLMPLITILSAAVLVGAVVAYLREERRSLTGATGLHIPPVSILIILLPVLAIVGAMWVNLYGNNLILLAGIIVVVLLFIIGVASQKAIPAKVYPVAVFAIALFLLFQSSLISRYVVPFGSDIPIEYYVSNLALKSASWSPVRVFPADVGYEYGRLNSMLSVTILPSVYSVLLNLDLTWVFKILYPLVFAFVPLGLYQLWQSTFGKKRAFIAAFFLTAESTFYTEMLGLARQMIAELFFVLLLVVIFDKKLKTSNKAICYVLFSIALVTAHYALAEIFLFFVSFVLIYSVVTKRISRKVTIAMVVFFFVIMFLWYIYTSGSATFNSFVSFAQNVYSQLSNFFSPSSRGQTVLEGLGLAAAPSFLNTVSRYLAYITEALIALGFVSIVVRRTSIKFEREYLAFTMGAAVFLSMLIAVPGLANTLNMTRFYEILLFLLAPLCVLGAEFLVKPLAHTRLFKKRTEIIALALLVIILVPYFLFQTGFVYEISKSQSYSLSLSGNRMGPVFLYEQFGYASDRDVSGALWLWERANTENSEIYADAISANSVLTSYGMVYRPDIEILSNVTALSGNAIVYLSEVNTANGIIIGSQTWNTTSLANVFSLTDSVYSNGGCQIYYNAISQGP